MSDGSESKCDCLARYGSEMCIFAAQGITHAEFEAAMSEWRATSPTSAVEGIVGELCPIQRMPWHRELVRRMARRIQDELDEQFPVREEDGRDPFDRDFTEPYEP